MLLSIHLYQLNESMVHYYVIKLLVAELDVLDDVLVQSVAFHVQSFVETMDRQMMLTMAEKSHDDVQQQLIGVPLIVNWMRGYS